MRTRILIAGALLVIFAFVVMWPQPPDDAVAAPRQPRPYANMWCWSKTDSVDFNVLATPGSNLWGFSLSVTHTAGSVVGADLATIVAYLSGGDSATVNIGAIAAGNTSWYIPARVTGFRVQKAGDQVPFKLSVSICGWYE
jgi:hypothetical protein